MKCDELQSYKGDVTIPVYGTIADAEVYLKKDVDAAIAELKAENERLKEKLMPCLNGDCILTCEVVEKYGKEIAELKQTIDKLEGAKKSAELILMSLLDCGLIKEWYFNGKFNAILKADDPHLKIAELKQKLEDAKASMYADVVDANMENRRLRRLLWHAIALFCGRSCEYFNGIMSHCLMGQDDLYKRCEEKKYKYLHTMYKCQAKAEEYK